MLRGGLIPRSKGAAATDAEISSGETHPQAAMKADVAGGGGAPAFAAPSKSGGSELFDALLMAATGASLNYTLKSQHAQDSGSTALKCFGHRALAFLLLCWLCGTQLQLCSLPCFAHV